MGLQPRHFGFTMTDCMISDCISAQCHLFTLNTCLQSDMDVVVFLQRLIHFVYLIELYAHFMKLHMCDPLIE